MYYVRKSSGQKEIFDLKKLRLSLDKAGIGESLINQIIDTIHAQHPRSTQDIHKLVITVLEQQSPHLAARYNLKRALMELGPAGYPFEKFISHIFEKQGFKVSTTQIVPGACIDHEVDVVAYNDQNHYIVECKYHNKPGFKSDVKVTLYTQARFEDIRDAQTLNKNKKNYQAFVVTNTQFTTQAIKYAECKNIRILSWKYPEDNGLAYLIEQFSLQPITSITTLSKAQKRQLLKNGLILCRDAPKHRDLLQKIGIPPHQVNRLINEMKAVCSVNNTEESI